ncbi:MAG: hypothetical protein M1836_004278 [Candelina mexicana]|nr:MAG: hypothetical protein M1836_004278 [Candelina mexicana]
MSAPGSGILCATYNGYVAHTSDALILFEACLNGTLSHVPRRPHDRERSSLIRSGCVFIYEENASGIKRWTDGVPWSPSRILGNFLIYRELEKPFPPGEKKRATKRNKRPTKPGEPYPRSENPNSASNGFSPTTPTTPSLKQESSIDRDTERALIGSLVDSYGFKDDGLVKKTMSVNVQGVHHHLVSYYKTAHALSGQLREPSKDPALSNMKPRTELTSRQNFRAPLEEGDESLEAQLDGQRDAYGYGDRNLLDRRQVLGGQSYHQLPPQNGYYTNPEVMPYQHGAPQHSLPSSTFGMNAPSTSSTHGAYYGHASNTTSAPIKTEDYGPYNSGAHFASRFDDLNSSIATSGPPPDDRGEAAYHQHALQMRPSGGETAIDSRSGGTFYDRNHLSDPSRAIVSSYHPDQRAWPTAPRPENVQQYSSWSNNQHSPAGHGHYAVAPHWNNDGARLM